MTQPAPTAPLSADLDATFLPVGQMRQIDRVTRIDGPTIVGEMDLGPRHWVYPLHFPGDPIFPGSLMIEAAGQLIALWAWARGQRGRPRLVRTSAQFHRPVEPGGGRLELVGTIRGKRHLQFGSVELLVAGEPVATIDAVLAILP